MTDKYVKEVDKMIDAKSKEILAYLVDKKGTGVTNAELAAILFEEKEYDRSLQKQMQVYISDLMKVLKDAGASDVVIKKYNSLSVNIDTFQCDYYDFLKMDVYAINSYMGEYMINYSWSEFTTGMLEEKYRKYSSSFRSFGERDRKILGKTGKSHGRHLS